MNPKLSIIVPIYCAESLLFRCIDSILQQEFRSFELLLVDDGSPDNSGKICDAFAARDSRIHVIHKPNGGAASARNAGLDLANGEYIGFVDADDWIEPEMYAAMMEEAGKGADWVLCDYQKHSADGRVRRMDQPLEGGFYDEACYREIYYPMLLMREDLEFPPSISNCVCIFRREMIEREGIRYIEHHRYCEDALFGSRCALAAERFSYLKGFCPYHYNFTLGSTTNTYHADKWDVFKRIMADSRAIFGQRQDFDFSGQLKAQALYFACNTIGEILGHKGGGLFEKRERIAAVLEDGACKDAYAGGYAPEKLSWGMRLQLGLMSRGMPGMICIVHLIRRLYA